MGPRQGGEDVDMWQLELDWLVMALQAGACAAASTKELRHLQW